MSKLSKADRDKLPASSFALPKQRLYPIIDQDDIDSAVSLVGKHPEAKPGIIRRAHAIKGKLPDSWTTADMSAGTEMVIKRGKLFEAGDYAGQQFSITPEEMLAAVEAFVPVPVRDTHFTRGTSLLEGKLGSVQSIALDPSDPYTLTGEVAIPKWLDDALAGTELSVSAEWSRETKQLQGLALLSDPQVEDAILFAAFTKATQESPVAGETPQQAGTDHISGTAVQFSTDQSRRNGMSFGERLKSWINGGMEGDLSLSDEPVAPVAAFSAPVVAQGTPAPDPEKEAMKAEIAALKAGRIQAEAVGFADAEIAAHRAYPAEREALIAAFSQASYDDGAGSAQFSAGKSRVQLLRDAAAARPAHALTTEQLRPEDLTAVFNQMTTAQAGAPKPMTPERKSELLGMTGTGRDVLAQRNGNHN